MIKTAPSTYQECEFRTQFGTLRGKRWGREGGKPVLALHGWLDNCASFDLLAPLILDADIVALDLAGNGYSDFRPGAGPYNIWQDLHDIHAVVSVLGWQEFSIIGHSKGAMFGFFYAGTFPHAIQHLVCLDAFCPEPVEAPATPKQLASAIISAAKGAEEKKNIYVSLEEATLARCNGLFKLNKDDAEIFAQRGVVAVEKGFQWHFDSKLLLPSDVKFTQGQLTAFLKNIKVSILLLVAENGIAGVYGEALNEIRQLHQVAVETLPGGHHFHMSENASGVAQRINEYFSQDAR